LAGRPPRSTFSECDAEQIQATAAAPASQAGGTAAANDHVTLEAHGTFQRTQQWAAGMCAAVVPDSQAATDDHVVDQAHRSPVLGWELRCNGKQGWLRASVCDHTQVVRVTQLQQASATAVVTAHSRS
jgi:hypothetical protein